MLPRLCEWVCGFVGCLIAISVVESRAVIPAQVADSLLLVYSAGAEVDPQGQLCLDCCFSQGLPATLHTVQVSTDTSYSKLFTHAQV